MSQANKAGIRIYAAGGGGLGICKYFEGDRKKEIPGFANLHTVYLDTSPASKSGVPEEYLYQLPEANGSGGVRSTHGAEIMRHTGEILQRFPAMQHNIFVHSTGGGSGAVLCASIASQLLAEGKTVIWFCVASDDSLQYINNSIAAMSTFDNIARLREEGAVVRYLQNGVDGTIEQVDAEVRNMIASLALLYSGENKNLDDRDLHNWTHFTKVTSFDPQVGALSIHKGDIELPEGSNIISVVTLNKDLNNTRTNHPVEYQRVGIPSDYEDMAQTDKPVHFVISDGYLDTVMKRLRKQKQDYDTKANARVVRNKLSDGTAPMEANGIVF